MLTANRYPVVLPTDADYMLHDSDGSHPRDSELFFQVWTPGMKCGTDRPTLGGSDQWEEV